MLGLFDGFLQIVTLLGEHQVRDDDVVLVFVVILHQAAVARVTESVCQGDFLLGELIFLKTIIIEIHCMF